MTCIAGVVFNGDVYIGGDSAYLSGYGLTLMATEKVFDNGPMIFGTAGSPRVAQLIRYALDIPAHDERRQSDEQYLVTTFTDAVRNVLKAGGAAERNNEQEFNGGGHLLIGYRGKIATVYDDYQVDVPLHGFAAIGCGEDLANGSLFSTEGQPPKERIVRALQAAERFNAGVRGPFSVIQLKGEKRRGR